MFNRRLLISEAGGDSNLIAGLTVGVNGSYYGFSDGSISGTGGIYGKIEPNPITISGKTGQIKCLYMAGRNVVVMWIKLNVVYTIKCIISNPNIELPTEPPIEI